MSNRTDECHLNEGDKRLVSESFLPIVYEELRQLAAQKLAREARHHTLQPTALVHEAYLRLVGDNASWENRAHFFGAAAEAMRRILIDHARSKQRLKRRKKPQRDFDLDSVEDVFKQTSEDFLALDEVLTRLESVDPIKARLVKLKFYAGLSIRDASELLGISPRTGERYWAFARAWLYQELSADYDEEASTTLSTKRTSSGTP